MKSRAPLGCSFSPMTFLYGFNCRLHLSLVFDERSYHRGDIEVPARPAARTRMSVGACNFRLLPLRKRSGEHRVETAGSIAKMPSPDKRFSSDDVLGVVFTSTTHVCVPFNPVGWPLSARVVRFRLRGTSHRLRRETR